MATEDALPKLPHRPEPAREKTDGSLDEKIDEKLNNKREGSRDEPFELETQAQLDRQHVVTTGQDVSRYVVDLRDDEDPALTFRSLVLAP